SDFVSRVSQLLKDLIGMLPHRYRRPLDLAGGAAEPRRRRRLGNTLPDPVIFPGPVVGMMGRLVQRKDRTEADIRALHQGAPFVPAAGAECGGEARLECRPAAFVI